MFVSDGGVSGVYSAVIVKSNFGGIYGERVFQTPPLFEKTFVTPQCDFSGGLPQKTADACLSWTAVVAGDSHRHAQEHVQSKEWSGTSSLNLPSVILQAAFRLERPTRVGTSSLNLPMAVTKVFFKGHPKHLVLKKSCWGNLSTIAAPSCSA